MFNLAKKAKKDHNGEDDGSSDTKKKPTDNDGEVQKPALVQVARKLAVRDRLLSKEVPELRDQNLPKQCQLNWEDVDKLEDFHLTVKPDEGDWRGGCFKFHITVPPGYNMEPPKVQCLTRIWHPNINEEGGVCLSVLRPSSFTGDQGWLPTRQLKDVVWGINSLFTDLLNFDDSLNQAAADQFKLKPGEFKHKVQRYIRNYCNPRQQGTQAGRGGGGRRPAAYTVPDDSDGEDEDEDDEDEDNEY